MGLTAVLEVLAKEGAGVLHGSLWEVVGSSVPFVYRAGGLNFLNGVVSLSWSV